MSKYKVGDKVVMEITNRFKNAYGHEYCSVLDSLYSADFIDNKVEPLSTYTEPLEAKIRRQAAEITRLLAENKELKEEYNQTFNQGAEEAWELTRKIICPPINGGFNRSEITEIFGYGYISDIFEKYKYTEAAAKVAEWEKAKEEIKVGDVVSHEEKYGVVISEGTICFRGFTDDGTPFEWYKERCTKTGRHIDIDSFLKQIGGGDDEK